MTEVIAAGREVALETAADALEQGAVIAVPTDTVYGLVCLYNEPAAIGRLFAVKGRPLHKALPVLLGDTDQAQVVVQPGRSPLAQAVMARFWPGPLTLVLRSRPGLPAALTAGGRTVGVRVPAHPFLRALARRVGPLASSSANRSSAPPCATPAAVLEQLDGRIPLVIDGGPAPLARASTVLDLSGPAPKVLRPGPVGRDLLAAVGIDAEEGVQ